MTARTQTVEKAHAEAILPPRTHQTESRISLLANGGSRGAHDALEQSTHLPTSNSKANNPSTARAVSTGKHLIITGLPPRLLLDIIDRPAKPSSQLVFSPSKTPRSTSKRKRADTNGTANQSVGGDDASLSDDGSEDGNDLDDGTDPETRKNAVADPFQPPARKRRRRGQPALALSSLPTREPSPEVPLIAEEDDVLQAIDLPYPFLSHSPSPDPDDPDDEASKIYWATYEPLTNAEAFVQALSRINPAQRRNEVLYELAANTAAALRAWQDEYLEIDRLTAPHAPIPRKPATANRQPLSPTLFEDLKEADIYDYVFDPKKVGHQDPIAQHIIRDASGRELRQRAPKPRTTADSLLVNASNIYSEDEGGRRRARKPVNKYDGITPESQKRKRGISSVTESGEFDSAPKRGRWGGRGRGRGRGRGGRGGSNGFVDRRIREMREASAATATSASAEDESASEAGVPESYSREGSQAPSLAESLNDDNDDDYQAGGQKKGRPKGSKNLHPRSDKGIPKGPRQGKTTANAGDEADTSAHTGLDVSIGSAEMDDGSPSKQAKAAKAAAAKGPKSEKRSSSMTAWWAKRKAAALEARGKLVDGMPSELAPNTKPKAKLEKIAQKPMKQEYGAPTSMPYPYGPQSGLVAMYPQTSGPGMPQAYQYAPNGYGASPPTGPYQQQHHYGQAEHMRHEFHHQQAPYPAPQHQYPQQYAAQPPQSQAGPQRSMHDQPVPSHYPPAYSHAYPHASQPPQPSRQLYQGQDPRAHGLPPATSPPAQHQPPHTNGRRVHEYPHPLPPLSRPIEYVRSDMRAGVTEAYDRARHIDEARAPPPRQQYSPPPKDGHGGYYAGSARHAPPPAPLAPGYAGGSVPPDGAGPTGPGGRQIMPPASAPTNEQRHAGDGYSGGRYQY